MRVRPAVLRGIVSAARRLSPGKAGDAGQESVCPAPSPPRRPRPPRWLRRPRRRPPLCSPSLLSAPVGKALMGRKAGERVEIAVSPEMKYTVEIRAVEKGEDDASLDISAY